VGHSCARCPLPCATPHLPPTQCSAPASTRLLRPAPLSTCTARLPPQVLLEEEVARYRTALRAEQRRWVPPGPGPATHPGACCPPLPSTPLPSCGATLPVLRALALCCRCAQLEATLARERTTWGLERGNLRRVGESTQGFRHTPAPLHGMLQQLHVLARRGGGVQPSPTACGLGPTPLQPTHTHGFQTNLLLC
jgi:hypothetical protein